MRNTQYAATLTRPPATLLLIAVATAVSLRAQPLTEYRGLDLISSATPVLFTTFAGEMTPTAWATFPGLVQPREPALAIGVVPPAYSLDDIYVTLEGANRSWLPGVWLGQSYVDSDCRVTSDTSGGWRRTEKTTAYYNAGVWRSFGGSRRTSISVFFGQSRNQQTDSLYEPSRSIFPARLDERLYEASYVTVTSGVPIGRASLLRVGLRLRDANNNQLSESGNHPDSMAMDFRYSSLNDERSVTLSAGFAPWCTDRLFAFVNAGLTLAGTNKWWRVDQRLDASPYLELAAARAWRGRHVALWGGVSIAANATLFGPSGPMNRPLSDRIRELSWDDSERELCVKVPLTLRITPAQKWCVAFNWEPSLTWLSTEDTHPTADSSWDVSTSLARLGALIEYTPVPWVRISFSPELVSSTLVAGLEGRILLGSASDARRKAAERKQKRQEQ